MLVKILWVLQVITPCPQVPLPLTQPTALPSPLLSPLPSPSNGTTSTQSGCSLFPLLNSLLQTNIIQRVCVCHLVIQFCTSLGEANKFWHVVLFSTGWHFEFNEASCQWWLYRYKHLMPLYLHIYYAVDCFHLVFPTSVNRAVDGGCTQSLTTMTEKSLVCFCTEFLSKFIIIYEPNLSSISSLFIRLWMCIFLNS